MLREAVMQSLRRLLQLLLFCTVAHFFVYLSAISLSAWWLSSAEGALGRHLRFPYLSDYVAKRFDKADKFFIFPLSQDLAVAVWVFWGLTFVASLLALAIKALPPHTIQKPIKHGSQPKWRITDAAYRIAQYELGPRRFWWWWCGGLKVHDALVVALWLALNVLCIQQRASLELPRLQASIEHHGGELAGWDRRMVYLGTTAGAFGWAATLDIMLLFFPVPRSTFLHWLLGSSFPALIKYHRWLGHGVVAVLTIHGWGYWALWLWEGTDARGLIWDPYGSNMLSGALSWFAGAILWVTSLAYVRRHYFEIFYRTHIICFVIFMVFGYIHHYQLWAYTMPGLILYLLDVIFRIAQQAQPVRLRIASIKGNLQLATLQFDTDPLTPQDPIQEVYVSSNSISPLQWHPFTTVPGQQPNSMVSIIKRYGKWTGDLMTRLDRQGDITVRVDGPYGESEENPAWVKHPTLVIFAGGIGVTPVLGIIQDLNRRRRDYKESQVQSAEKQVPSQVHLVFSARAQAELSLLQSDIISEARALDWLSLELYLTVRQPPAESGPAKPSRGSLSHSSSESSTAALNRSYVRHTLPPYHFGNLHWACAHVAAFAGAVLGGVGAWAYAAKEKAHHHRPVHDWTIGAILIVASGLGCMLAAALVIVLVHTLHALRMRKLAKQGKSRTPDQDADGIGDADVERTPMSLPKAHTGRPNVGDMLTSLCEQHSNERSIVVIAAGPQKMVESVAIACAARNDRLGLCGMPYLDVKQYTFSL